MQPGGGCFKKKIAGDAGRGFWEQEVHPVHKCFPFHFLYLHTQKTTQLSNACTAFIYLKPLQIPLGPTPDHPLNAILILDQPHLPVRIFHRVRLHEYLPWDFPLQHQIPHLLCPECASWLVAPAAPAHPLHPRHILIQPFAPLQIRSGLENVQLLQITLDGFPADGEDLAPIQPHGEIVQRAVRALHDIDPTEPLARAQEGFEDAEAGLHVRLPPLLGLGVPELEGDDAGARHGEVGRVEDVAGGARHVDFGVVAGAEAEEGEDAEVAGEGHGDAFGAAFLVGRGEGGEEGGVRFGGFVVGGAGFPRHGAEGGVLPVEVEDARRGFLEQFAGAVAKEFVDADLDFEGGVAVGGVAVQVGRMDKGDGFVGGFGGEDVAKGDILESVGLTDVIVVRNIDS